MDINTIIQNIIHKVNWLDILQETIMITSFVVIIMILIEILSLAAKEKLKNLLNKNSYLQIIIGCLFGLIPGCMGTFIVVALYSENVISIATLIATMIATVGDEAFFMLAIMPKDAFLLFAILAVLAILTGFIINLISKKRNKNIKKETKIIHKETIKINETGHSCSEHQSHNNFSIKNFGLNKYKIILIFILLVVIGLFATNTIGHNHNHGETDEHSECCHHEEESCTEHEHASFSIANHEGAEGLIIKITIIVAASFLIILLLFSSNHFVKNHIFEHILLRHFPKIFLWISLTLVVINSLLLFIDVEVWIENNYFIMLLIAIAIGLIPQSGPHLIFVSLFVSGTIPFSVLLANSIVQDGHGGLPLLAENKKAFVLKKSISIVLAVMIGFLFWLIK